MRWLARLPIIRWFVWKRYRMCARKVAHRRESEAKAEARRLGTGAHAYRCPYCNGFHVGH